MYFIFELINLYFLPNNPYVAPYVLTRVFFAFFLLMFFSSIAFMTNFWTLWESTFFYCAHCEKKRLFVMLCEEKNDFPWCYVRCFGIYDKGCKISRSIWVHPCFFVTCLCLHINWSTCGFNGWWMLFDVIIP